MQQAVSSVVSTAARPRGGAAPAACAVFVALLAALFALPVASSSDFTFPAVEHGAALAVMACLCALPLIDPRDPWRWAHADVLALLLPVAGLLLTQPQRPWAVFFVYGALAYLALRLLVLARRGDRDGVREHACDAWQRARAGAGARERVRAEADAWLPTALLLAGIAALVAVHLLWALASGASTDAGTGTVAGALRLVHGEALYSATAAKGHTDTYGPLTYEAYVPFALLFDAHAAQHVAPLFYDLLTAALLFALGRRARGVRTGALLCFCWLAFPLTAYTEALGFTDPVVAAALAALLLARSRPQGSGWALAAAGWAKFTPFALLPLALLSARAEPERRPRARVAFVAALVAASALIVLPGLLGSSPSRFVADTVGFQLGREPANSMWSVLQNSYATAAPWLGVVSRTAHALVLALSGALVLFAARVPRAGGRDSTAALSGALLACAIFSDGYFSYNYLLWLAPMVLVVLVRAPASLPPLAPTAPGPGLHRARRPARSYAALRFR